jgi:catechol 2,3-dioxygenase-like lactoylglutathione lyase family enzyme
MTTTAIKPRVTSFAPQFLVDDLERSIGYYEKLGFTFGEPWDGFYAIGHLDGLELHLKEAPKNQDERRHRRDNEHLDAAAGVDGIEAFFRQCVANGATILKPLTPTAWGTMDFFVEDPDGYIILLWRPSDGRLTQACGEAREASFQGSSNAQRAPADAWRYVAGVARHSDGMVA